MADRRSHGILDVGVGALAGQRILDADRHDDPRIVEGGTGDVAREVARRQGGLVVSGVLPLIIATREVRGPGLAEITVARSAAPAMCTIFQARFLLMPSTRPQARIAVGSGTTEWIAAVTASDSAVARASSAARSAAYPVVGVDSRITGHVRIRGITVRLRTLGIKNRPKRRLAQRRRNLERRVPNHRHPHPPPGIDSV